MDSALCGQSTTSGPNRRNEAVISSETHRHRVTAGHGGSQRSQQSYSGVTGLTAELQRGYRAHSGVTAGHRGTAELQRGYRAHSGVTEGIKGPGGPRMLQGQNGVMGVTVGLQLVYIGHGGVTEVL